MDAQSPNATYGEISWVELGWLILTVLYALYITVPKVLLRRLSARFLSTPPRSALPDTLKHDLLLEMIRNVRAHLTTRQIRYLTLPGPAAADVSLTSNRYSAYKSEIFTPVCQSGVDGYWITLPKGPSPKDTNAVIYFLHGGGFNALLPHHFLTFLLRLLETFSSQYHLTVSVFALDYKLAPEAAFPKQLEEITKGWEYLTSQVGISPNKIVAMGDSAGGNLLLSFLTHLAYPHPAIGGTIGAARPGSAALLSPWTTFRTSAESYTTNRKHDLLPISELRYLISMFRGKVPETDPLFQKYAEFVHPVADFKRNWNTILPEYSWIGAGERELLISDIVEFVEQAKKDGAKVEFWIGKGMWHDPWAFETLMPGGKDVDAFLKTPVQERVKESVLPETARLAGAVAELIRKSA